MNTQLRDKLLEAEPEDAALRAEYERRLAAMIEMPLTWYRKAGLVFGALACVATAVITGVVIFGVRHLPPAAVGGLAAGGALALVGAIIAGRILARGTYRRDRDSAAQAGLIWMFAVVLITSFMLTGGIDSIRGVGLTVIGIVFVIFAGVLLLRTVIEQSELRTREKLLELELRLTRITDELTKARRGPGPEKL